MTAPIQHRTPYTDPTWFRHSKPQVDWPRGYPHPEDEPTVTCPSCHGDLIDYSDDLAVAGGLPSCRDGGRSC